MIHTSPVTSSLLTGTADRSVARKTPLLSGETTSLGGEEERRRGGGRLFSDEEDPLGKCAIAVTSSCDW